jgi:L-fuculose-phosphate aldolase
VTKREVVATIRWLAARGLYAGTSGNISARDAGNVQSKGGFLITPTGIPCHEVRPAEIVAMDERGRSIGTVQPSSEWRIHRDIYRRRPDVGAVVHTHSTFATAISCLRRDVPAFHYMVAKAGGSVIPCARYATYGTEALSKNAVAALGGGRACLLANHGLIAVGESLAAARLLAEEIEAICQQYWAARAIGRPVVLPRAEMRAVIARFALVIAGLFLAAVLAQAADPAGWRTVDRGVEHLRVADADADLVRFDLQQFRVDVVVPGAGRPLSAAELRKQRGGVLAVNGGFFDTDGRPLGLRISAGKRIIPLRAVVDWGVLTLRDQGAAIVHSRDYAKQDPAGISDAIQVGPRILIDGRAPGLKPQAARRTAVAVDKTGRFLTFVVARKRVEASALAAVLARLGFDRALMLDGGPSTQLSAAIGTLQLEIPGGYPVPDGLVVRRR